MNLNSIKDKLEEILNEPQDLPFVIGAITLVGFYLAAVTVWSFQDTPSNNTQPRRDNDNHGEHQGRTRAQENWERVIDQQMERRRQVARQNIHILRRELITEVKKRENRKNI